MQALAMRGLFDRVVKQWSSLAAPLATDAQKATLQYPVICALELCTEFHVDNLWSKVPALVSPLELLAGADATGESQGSPGTANPTWHWSAVNARASMSALIKVIRNYQNIHGNMSWTWADQKMQN